MLDFDGSILILPEIDFGSNGPIANARWTNRLLAYKYTVVSDPQNFCDGCGALLPYHEGLVYQSTPLHANAIRDMEGREQYCDKCVQTAYDSWLGDPWSIWNTVRDDAPAPLWLAGTYSDKWETL